MAMMTPARVMMMGSLRSRGPPRRGVTGAGSSRTVDGASIRVGRRRCEVARDGVARHAGDSATGRKPSRPRTVIASPRTRAVEVTMNRNGGNSVILAGMVGR